MDYEKLYKEALERAKSFESPEYKNIMASVFPELQESDDERIRKEIIDVIRHSVNSMPADSFNERIAWLEKQNHDGKKWIYEDVYLKEKEQLIQDGIDEVLENPQKYGLEKQCEPIDRIVKRATTEKQRVLLTETNGDANIDWDARSLKDVRALLEHGLDYITKLEKQGEQKPTDKVEPKFKVGDTIQPKDRGHEPWQIMQVDILDKKYRFKDGYVIHFSQEDNYELVEQTHAWSEKDEIRLKHILCLLDVKDDKKYLLMFGLNSLQDLKKDIAWLKSLRPQNTWKPSESDIRILEQVIDGKVNPIKYHSTLHGILEQLKKLREE